MQELEDVIELLEVTFTNEGQEKNRKETIAYYSEVATEYETEYEVDEMLGRFRYITQDVNRFKAYWREWEAIQEWVTKVTTGGTVVELGSGTGQWVSTWLKHAERVVCVDASSEMLSISKIKNRSASIEHVQGNILDTSWLKRFLREVGEIDVIVLAFVLGSLTVNQEKQCLAILREAVRPGCSIVLSENQSSIFSDPVFYSRVNIQQRFSLNGDKASEYTKGLSLLMKLTGYLMDGAKLPTCSTQKTTLLRAKPKRFEYASPFNRMATGAAALPFVPFSKQWAWAVSTVEVEAPLDA